MSGETCGARYFPANGEAVTPCELPAGHVGEHQGWCLGSRCRWSGGEVERETYRSGWPDVTGVDLGDGIHTAAVEGSPFSPGTKVERLSVKGRCTCDDFCDDPCPVPGHSAVIVCGPCSEAGGADMPVHHAPPECSR